MRGVTADEIKITGTIEFQLTRLMRGVTVACEESQRVCTISTHTPHARRDVIISKAYAEQPNFNSHASCEA